jgi:hypothetical protein
MRAGKEITKMENGFLLKIRDTLRHKERMSGQLLSVFVFILAIAFLLMSMTINTGKASMRRIAINNATDKAALLYASELGSWAHKLSVEYVEGKDKYCYESVNVMGIIMTIVFTAIMLYATLAAIGAAAVGGTAAGGVAAGGGAAATGGIGGILASIGNAIVGALQGLIGAIQAIFGTIAQAIGMAFQAIGTALGNVGMALMSIGASLGGALGAVVSAIGAVIAHLGAFIVAIGNTIIAGAGAGGLLGAQVAGQTLGGMLAGALGFAVDGVFANIVNQVIAGAIVGAILGAFGGPKGAMIGALIGAVFAVFAGALGAAAPAGQGGAQGIESVAPPVEAEPVEPPAPDYAVEAGGPPAPESALEPVGPPAPQVAKSTSAPAQTGVKAAASQPASAPAPQATPAQAGSGTQSTVQTTRPGEDVVGAMSNRTGNATAQQGANIKQDSGIFQDPETGATFVKNSPWQNNANSAMDAAGNKYSIVNDNGTMSAPKNFGIQAEQLDRAMATEPIASAPGIGQGPATQTATSSTNQALSNRPAEVTSGDNSGIFQDPETGATFVKNSPWQNNANSAMDAAGNKYSIVNDNGTMRAPNNFGAEAEQLDRAMATEPIGKAPGQLEEGQDLTLTDFGPEDQLEQGEGLTGKAREAGVNKGQQLGLSKADSLGAAKAGLSMAKTAQVSGIAALATTGASAVDSYIVMPEVASQISKMLGRQPFDVQVAETPCINMLTATVDDSVKGRFSNWMLLRELSLQNGVQGLFSLLLGNHPLLDQLFFMINASKAMVDILRNKLLPLLNGLAELGITIPFLEPLRNSKEAFDHFDRLIGQAENLGIKIDPTVARTYETAFNTYTTDMKEIEDATRRFTGIDFENMIDVLKDVVPQVTPELVSKFHAEWAPERVQSETTTLLQFLQDNIYALTEYRERCNQFFRGLESLTVELMENADLSRTLNFIAGLLSVFAKEGFNVPFYLGGSATYSWHDSHGWHHVQAMASPYKKAKIAVKVKQTSPWTVLICILLKYHTGAVGVTVRRFDQNYDIGLSGGNQAELYRFKYSPDGLFDPSNPPAALQRGITSSAHAWYGYNSLTNYAKGSGILRWLPKPFLIPKAFFFLIPMDVKGFSGKCD